MDRSECDTPLIDQSVVLLCHDISPADEQLRAVVEASVGRVFSVRSQDFGSITRGRARAALARQVAMYLSHIACRRNFTDVGRIFARDRTTVAHACGVVEDLRDDQRFDRVLDLLETIVRFKLTPRGEK
jgi:chromosomal replication initiation ATPase DnaA